VHLGRSLFQIPICIPAILTEVAACKRRNGIQTDRQKPIPYSSDSLLVYANERRY
jgi:hypothetical protein